MQNQEEQQTRPSWEEYFKDLTYYFKGESSQ